MFPLFKDSVHTCMNKEHVCSLTNFSPKVIKKGSAACSNAEKKLLITINTEIRLLFTLREPFSI